MKSNANPVEQRAPGWLFSFKAFEAEILILAGIVALLFVLQTVRFLPVRSDNMYPEAAGVLSSLRWAEGHPLYQDYRQAPYLITPFPPVWYAVLAAGARLGFSDVTRLTFFGRIVSLVGLFGMLCIGYLYNRRLGFPHLLCLLTPLFYLAFPLLLPWAVTARPDLLAFFFGVISLYLVAFRVDATSVLGAGIIAALAFLTRHNAVAVPAAVVVWLVWRRRWKHVIAFSTAWWLTVTATLITFQIITHGAFLLNLSGATFGKFAFSYIRDVIGRVLSTPGNGFAVVLFAFGLFGFLQSWKDEDQRVRLISIYLAISLVMAVWGSAARGAAVNHYMEPALAMAMLVPLGISQLQHVWTHESPLAMFAMVLVLVFLLPSVDMQRSYFTHNRPDNLQRLEHLVVNRRVFTDVPYLAARSSNLELLEPASLLNTEMARGRTAWSSLAIADSLEHKQYELVVLGFPADTPYDPAALYPRYVHLDSAVRSSIVRNYRLCFQVDTSDVDGRVETRYVYGPSPTDANIASGCPVLEGPSSSERPIQNFSSMQ
jgi:hypothetical protein